MIIVYAVLSNTSSYIYNLVYGLVPRDNPFERYLYGFLTGIEYVSFALFIFLQIKNKNLRKLITYTSLAFIAFLVLFILFARDHKVDSIPIGVETILILVFCIFFFFEQINHPESLFIYDDYRFWIIIAFMFYLSGSFFIYIFSNQIPRSQILEIWQFTYVFYILKNILFSVGMLVLIQHPLQKGPNLSLKSYSELT